MNWSQYWQGYDFVNSLQIFAVVHGISLVLVSIWSSLCKPFVTYSAFEWLPSFMNWCNMLIQYPYGFSLVWVSHEPFKFEWLPSFMNWCNMLGIPLVFTCDFLHFRNESRILQFHLNLCFFHLWFKRVQLFVLTFVWPCVYISRNFSRLWHTSFFSSHGLNLRRPRIVNG